MKSFVDAESDGSVIGRREVGKRLRQWFRAVGEGRGIQHLLCLTLKHKDCFYVLFLKNMNYCDCIVHF